MADNSSSTQYSDDEIEQKLKDAAAAKGVTYDASDAADVAHRDNSQAGLDEELKKYDYRSDNTPNDGDNNNGNPTPWTGAPGAATPAGQWTNGTASGNTAAGSSINGGAATDAGNTVLSQILSELTNRDTQDATRRDALYGQLNTEATQSQNVDPNDPIIKGQTDSYQADQDRSARNYLADLAEKGGPDANIGTEQRMAAETAGQNTAGFHANLMANELMQRRTQIAQALDSMRGILTADQQASLQQQLGVLDNSIKQQGLGLQDKGLDIQSQLGNRGLDVDWQKALMQNTQFMDNLGLNAADRSAYWDYMNTNGGA